MRACVCVCVCTGVCYVCVQCVWLCVCTCVFVGSDEKEAE